MESVSTVYIKGFYVIGFYFNMCFMSVFQAAPMLVNSFLQASCQWFLGGALESNTPTMRPILTWWRKLMLSSTNQVLLWTPCWSYTVPLLHYLVSLLAVNLENDIDRFHDAEKFITICNAKCDVNQLLIHTIISLINVVVKKMGR